MKSTNNERKPFSMEDFEKGLMLAGLVSPNSVEEINERIELERYEKELKEEARQLYFKRVVLAAEIAYQLHSEPTFGRIKFQKLMYLCEHAIDMNLHHRYIKQAAGPFDNKFMHSIESEFKNHNWFEVEKVNDGFMKRSKYKLLPFVEKYKSYFESYFRAERDQIQYIINLFRTAKTDKTEIAATLYSCYLELKPTSQVSLVNTELFSKFYEWSEEKKRFDITTVESVWQWMLDKKLLELANK